MNDLADDPLFLDATLEWQRVSPKLMTEQRLSWGGLALVGAVVLALGVVLHSTASAPWWPFLVVGVLLALAGLFGWCVVVPRAVGSWRYVEREQDLLVRRGRIVRRLVVVPYGRMQIIEVSANPVSQRLGIATVTLVTASASTDARIPGLPSPVAQQLRDRLAAKGEASAAGL